MVVFCENCKMYCISWADNRQSCKCGNMKGFIVEDGNIKLELGNNGNVYVWMCDLQEYQKYSPDDKFDYDLWSGFHGQKFAI